MARMMMARTIRFLKQEDGPTAVEYAVMLALIVVVCIAAITTLGSNANKTFGNVALNTATSS
jgi:pilus assembly protein Flp/PilA